MADALCGPSNPLQSIQKHAAVDRTLQQDRLYTRPTSGQGFRSVDPRSGLLDAEFTAFETGQPFQHFAQTPAPPHFAQQTHTPPLRSQSQASGNSSWANDFQKLRLGPSQPIPASQFHIEAPLQRSQPGPAGWHADFMRQQQARQSPVQHAPVSYNNMQYSMNNSMPMAYESFNTNQHASMPQMQQAQEQSLEQDLMLDHAAFEDAFARAEVEHAEGLLDNSAQSTLAEEAVQEEAPVDDTVLQEEDIRIGSDLIPEGTVPQTEQQEREEADDLARTAGNLLNALKHEQSQKFQQSQFLSLMRRLRDREVEVQGEGLKETSNSKSSPREYPMAEHIEESNMHQPLHPGGPFYPERSPPPVEQGASMSGAITADDMDEFDNVAESSSLDHRFRRPRQESVPAYT